MNKKHDEAIFKRFDFFNPKGNIQETLIPFGLACSNGWYNIIYELFEKIKNYKDEWTEQELCICLIEKYKNEKRYDRKKYEEVYYG